MGLARVAFRSPASFSPLPFASTWLAARGDRFSGWRFCCRRGARQARRSPCFPPGNSRARPTSPSARDSAAMAYDAAHGQVVMFGGEDILGHPLGETWTYDGVTWTHQVPAPSPSARRDASMTSATAHNQVVLFGGTDGTSLFADTWTWNGTTWTQQPVITGPSKREGAAMAFDGSNVVLFGGSDGVTGDPSLGDTWIWNGSSWNQQDVTSPPAREQATMAYDAAQSQVVLFGGSAINGGSSLLSDTWTWDGTTTTWTSQSPATSPSARLGAMMAYDAVLSQMVLFGGENSSNLDLVDTWIWDGATTNWIQQSPAPEPLAERIRRDGL